MIFQSTPSARRATAGTVVEPIAPVISIHALREEGDTIRTSDDFAIDISIHALREEGDLYLRLCRLNRRLFQSTPSARRATVGISFDNRNFKFQSTPSARRAT